jgi:divalent metal cation (Fe/Co/Zn/Cd) transporter
LQELMDRLAESEVLDAVRREASGVLGVEKLLARKTGLENLVDPAASVREGHAIGHAAKDRLMGHIATIKDVLVHIEPCPRPTGDGRPA